MADGLNNCLVYSTQWPPGSVQFRALCLGQFTDKDGNDSSWQLAGKAYINFDDPKHPNYQAKQIESDEIKTKRKDAGQSALNDMKDLF